MAASSSSVLDEPVQRLDLDTIHHPVPPYEAVRRPSAGPLRAHVATPRVDAIDILRGLVIIVMALDHVREYFSVVRGLDLGAAPLAYFLTRWVTHFCAPTFCFLAGTSAYLSGRGRRTPAQLSRFLVTRGLWLIVAEMTLVNFGWFYHLRYPFDFGLGLQVIWALGASMIVLAGLVRLPLWVSVALGAAMVGGHNLFDGIQSADLGVWAPVWTTLHVQETFQLGALKIFIVYPLVPWIGVMALGYAFGAVLTRPAAIASRQRPALLIGLALTAAFVVLRAINGYGDPQPWTIKPAAVETITSFLNTAKYPPSLLYLLMTLGPALVALAWFSRWQGPMTAWLAVFGRVPFFFYIVHIYVIHTASVAAGVLQGFPASAMMDFCFFLPEEYGFSLPVVYVIWAAIVAALYPLCRWFAGVKARHRDQVWLSYL